MKDTTSIPHKTQEVAGILFGIVLFYSWLMFINDIKMLFFSERTIISGNEIITAHYWDQIDQWLGTGFILFFLVFGHYLFYSKNMNRIEKSRDIIGMKSALIGFILWLLITMITFLFRITVPYFLNIAGGYITIIFIYIIMKNRPQKLKLFL